MNPSSLPYLEEDLAKGTICFILENRRKYDSDTIVSRLYIDGLLISITNFHEFSREVHGPRAFESFLGGESAFERCSEGVPF
jgi:hypothetical protein